VPAFDMKLLQAIRPRVSLAPNNAPPFVASFSIQVD
jgi:hypothetical protein